MLLLQGYPRHKAMSKAVRIWSTESRATGWRWLTGYKVNQNILSSAPQIIASHRVVVDPQWTNGKDKRTSQLQALATERTTQRVPRFQRKRRQTMDHLDGISPAPLSYAPFIVYPFSRFRQRCHATYVALSCYTSITTTGIAAFAIITRLLCFLQHKSAFVLKKRKVVRFFCHVCCEFDLDLLHEGQLSSPFLLLLIITPSW